MAEPYSPAPPERPTRPFGAWFAAVVAVPEVSVGILALIARVDEYNHYSIAPNPVAVAAAVVALAAGAALVTLAVSGRGLLAARVLNIGLCVLIPVYIFFPHDPPMPVGGPMPPDPHGYVSIFLRVLILPPMVLVLIAVVGVLWSPSLTAWCTARREVRRARRARR